jgi:hypothetical protein
MVEDNTMIELLNTAIKKYTDGNELAFCKLIKMKDSTVRGWRQRDKIPDDKVVLLNTLIELHEAKEKLSKCEQYFELQSEVAKLLQK